MLNKEKIGQILTDLRGEASREEVAKAVGVSVSAWQMYENGQRIPKDEVKVRIASYFKKTVGEIFTLRQHKMCGFDKGGILCSSN